MSNELIAVENSEYEDYFENIKSDSVFLLSKSLAIDTWEKIIDLGAASYFSLPDDHWIVKSESKAIGEWFDAYNNDKPFKVAKVLKKHTNWSLSSKVWYFISKKVSFETTWETFLLHWDDFLAIDDDCPIVVCDSIDIKEAIVFKPMGAISLISKRS